MSLVLDASMTVAWLFAAERGDGPRAVLRRVVADGAVVPSLWRLEVANVLRNAVRRARCNANYADRSLERLHALPISIDAETDRHSWGETRRIALAHDLTVYDAAYLELAARLTFPLASCDVALSAAARRIGVEVLDGIV
jgi:predicted nucleic acid-binding protein